MHQHCHCTNAICVGCGAHCPELNQMWCPAANHNPGHYQIPVMMYDISDNRPNIAVPMMPAASFQSGPLDFIPVARPLQNMQHFGNVVPTGPYNGFNVPAPRCIFPANQSQEMVRPTQIGEFGNNTTHNVVPNGPYNGFNNGPTNQSREMILHPQIGAIQRNTSHNIIRGQDGIDFQERPQLGNGLAPLVRSVEHVAIVGPLVPVAVSPVGNGAPHVGPYGQVQQVYSNFTYHPPPAMFILSNDARTIENAPRNE